MIRIHNIVIVPTPEGEKAAIATAKQVGADDLEAWAKMKAEKEQLKQS